MPIHIHTHTYIYLYKYRSENESWRYIFICCNTSSSAAIHIHTHTYIYTHTHTYTSTNIGKRTRVGDTSSSAATTFSAAATRKERSNVRVGKISAPHVSAPSRKTRNSKRRRGAEGNTRGRGGFEKCPATFTNAYTSADACVCIHTCMHPRSWESRICKDGCLVSFFFHFCEV